MESSNLPLPNAVTPKLAKSSRNLFIVIYFDIMLVGGIEQIANASSRIPTSRSSLRHKTSFVERAAGPRTQPPASGHQRGIVSPKKTKMIQNTANTQIAANIRRLS